MSKYFQSIFIQSSKQSHMQDPEQFNLANHKKQLLSLIVDLLQDLGMNQTVQAIRNESIAKHEPVQQEDQEQLFEEQLAQLEKQTHKSYQEKRAIISQLLESRYLRLIKEQKLEEALELFTGKMSKYCYNLQKLSTYLLTSPPQACSRLLNVIAPYFLSQNCPPLPSYKSMRIVFDEQVWTVKSNPSGTLLAVLDSKINCTIISLTENKVQAQKYTIHEEDVTNLSWQDDEIFATSSVDHSVKIWRARDLNLITELKDHPGKVTCVLYTQKYLFTSGLDGRILIYTQNALKIKQINTHRKIQDMVVTHDSKYAMILTSKHSVSVIQVDSKDEVAKIKQKQKIFGIYLASPSSTNRWLYVSTSGARRAQIHVWNFERSELVQVWTGHQQSKFVLRPSHGGPYSEFVAVGSQNGDLLYYHVSNTEPMLRVSATKNKSVNCTSWINENTVAECNDQNSVQIWSAIEPKDGLIQVNAQDPQQTKTKVLEVMKQRLIRMMMRPSRLLQEDDSDLEYH